MTSVTQEFKIKKKTFGYFRIIGYFCTLITLSNYYTHYRGNLLISVAWKRRSVDNRKNFQRKANGLNGFENFRLALFY